MATTEKKPEPVKVTIHNRSPGPRYVHSIDPITGAARTINVAPKGSAVLSLMPAEIGNVISYPGMLVATQDGKQRIRGFTEDGKPRLDELPLDMQPKPEAKAGKSAGEDMTNDELRAAIEKRDGSPPPSGANKAELLAIFRKAPAPA